MGYTAEMYANEKNYTNITQVLRQRADTSKDKMPSSG
jgi:hypothetical protein